MGRSSKEQHFIALHDTDTALAFIEKVVGDEGDRNPTKVNSELALLLAADSANREDIQIAITRNASRTTAVAQTVYNLRAGIQPEGIASWFTFERYQLGEQTPLEYLNGTLVQHADVIRLSRPG